MEAEEILTYIKSPRNGSVCYFSSKLDVPSNVVQKKRVARILFFKIRSSQGILKIRDVQKKKVARILFFKIWSSQGILKVRDCTPMEAEEILTYIKSPRNGSVCYFSSKLDVPSNVVQKKRVARILFFKIRPSQEILKIRDGTPLEADEILTYIKCPRNGSVCYFSSKLDVSSNVVQKKKVARILFFKIKSSQGILKIRDGTPMEAEEILTYIKSPRNGSSGGNLTYIKSPRNGSACYFSSKLDVPSNVVQKKRVARILFFKIRPSQEILKIRDGTPLEADEILTYIKCPRNGSVCYFSSKLDVSSNVVQKKKVAEEILTYIKSPRNGSSGGNLTYIKSPRNGSVCYFSSKLDVPSNVVQKKRVARILFFKIRPSQEILKIRDGTPLEAQEILTYIKSPRNGSVCYFSSKLDVPSNVVQKKRVARILFFKIRPSQEILKIRDGYPFGGGGNVDIHKKPSKRIDLLLFKQVRCPYNVVQKKKVARILFFKIWSSQGILKVRDCTPMEAEEILTYIKSPRNGSVCYFSSKLDVPSNVVQKKRVARILFFKIRPSQEILKIRDGTPLEADEILTYIKCPRSGSVCYFSSKLDVSSNVVQKKKVARILFFKIKSSQGILKIRDGTPMEAEEILTYIKSPRNGSVCGGNLTYIKSPRNGSACYFSSKLDVPSNVVQKKRVARILFFKIRPSQEILKIRDGTPLEADEILTYIKCPRNGSVCYFSSKLDVSSNVVQKKKAEEILTYIKSPRNGSVCGGNLTYIKSPRNGSACYFSSKLDVPSNVVQKKRVARILFFKIRPSQEILKIRDGTPLEADEILTYIKCPRNGSVCYFSSKLDVSSNVVQKKKVAEEILTYIKSPRNGSVCYFSSKLDVPSGGNLTYIKSPRNGSVCYFSSKLDVPSNVVQKKRVARILFFKIRPSQEILKIRDGTPLEAQEILTYIKSPRNGSVCYFSSKLDVPSNVVQKKRVARILFFKIRPSQEILKIRDGYPFGGGGNVDIHKKPSKRIDLLLFKQVRCPYKLDVSSNVVQKKKVARILFFKIWSSQGILKVRDCTPMEAEEILTYIKSPRNGSVCYFSSKLDVPSNVVQKKRVARILFFKIRPSQEILKIRDGTPLEADEILTYIKCPRSGSVCYFSSKLDVSSNVVQKKKVARILFFKIKSSQGILKIRDGTPMEAEEILTYIKSPRNGSSGGNLTYIKSPRNGSACYFSSKLDVPSNVVQKKRVARILFFKIRPSQEILKIRDGTPLEADEILTYIKCPRNGSVCYFSSKLDVSSNVVQKKKVAEEILTYIKSPRNGSVCYFSSKLDVPSGGNLTYIKSPRNGSVCYFSSKLDVPSNVVQKKRVARILFFKIRPSQEILKIRDGTPLEAQEILTYIKSPRNGSVCYFSSKLDVPSNVVQKKRVARILFFKIRPSQEILKIRDGYPFGGGGNVDIHKKPSKRIDLLLFKQVRCPYKLDVSSNVVQKKKVARILFFKIWSSQGILKVRDCTPMEAEEILTYIKSPRNGSVCYFSSKLDVPSNVVQKKRVARILFFKIRPSQEILKIRDGTPLEADEILTYIKCPRSGSVCYFSSKLDVSSNVVQKKKVARILFFKIKSSQGILKIRDGTPMEAEEILTYIKSPRNGSSGGNLTYIKSPRNGSACYFSSKLDVPSNVVQKKRVARILFFKIRPSQEILKIRDGTPLEADEILTYIKCPRNGSVCYFSSKLDVSSNVVQKKKVAEEILTYIKSPRNGSRNLTYIKSPRNGSVCYFSSKLDVPSNVVQKKRVARILFFKIRPSQEILKIRDGTPLEAQEILTYIKSPRNGSKF
ncbi:hypothetical protein OROHE_011239 [Orobanche hederae]